MAIKSSQISIERKNHYTGHLNSLYALEVVGKDHVYSSGADGWIAEWHLNEKDKGTLLAKLNNSCYCIAHRKAFNQLIVAENNSGLHLIDLNTKQEIGSLQITDALMFDLKLDATETLAYVANSIGELIVVDLLEMRVRSRISISYKSLRTISLSLEHIIIGDSEGNLTMLSTDDLATVTKFAAHSDSVFSTLLIPESGFLISGGKDAKLKVWDIKAGGALLQEIPAHLYAVNSLTFNPKLNLIASGSKDKTIKLWAADTFKLLKVIDKDRYGSHLSSVNKVNWESWSNLLLSVSDDKTLAAWEINILA